MIINEIVSSESGSELDTVTAPPASRTPIPEPLQYASYDSVQPLASEELVVVDCHYHRGLVLTHLYEPRVPKAVRANTSTQTVVNALRQGVITTQRSVTCNHWDIDGFLAVWSVLNPELALKSAELLIAAATLGDFREFDPTTAVGLLALKICSLLNAEESTHFCLPFGDLEDATIEYKVAHQKFNYFLPRFFEWLSDLDKFEASWRPEYDLVLKNIQSIESGEVAIEEVPEIGLSIVRTLRPLHYYSICSSIQGGALLTIIDHSIEQPVRRYVEFEYRYETRVGRLDKPTIERKNLDRLAERLTALEQEPGIRWTFDNILLGGPMLRPEHRDKPLTREECYQSLAYRLEHHPELRTSIEPGTIVNAIVGELRAKS